MTSLRAHALHRVLRLSVKSFRGSQQGFVRRFRLITRAAGVAARLPRGVIATRDHVGGVPGEWLIPQGARGLLLYCHGGAFVTGSPAMYRSFCASLAKALRLRVFVPDYRLAPEHPFPAAPDDALAAYRAAIARLKPEEALVIAGDSAGGNLALGVMQQAVAGGLRVPDCAVLISPGLDLTCSGAALDANDRSDHMLSRHIIDHAVAAYLPAGDAADPVASPLWGEMAGLPPLLVSVSDSECLRDDSYRLRDRAAAAGVPVRLLARPDMTHVWPVFVQLLPEADEDFRTITRFVEDSLADAGHDRSRQ